MKILSYILVFLLGGLVSYCGTEHFHKPEIIEVEKEVIKEKIIEKEKEVVKWKEKKAKIVYTTIFDTLVTKETIYAELQKCDTIVKIDSVIIASQDTIILDQKQVISIIESDNLELKKQVKKEKRKNLFTKIGAGIVIVAILLLK